MIGSLPLSARAPVEYGQALDAAMTWLVAEPASEPVARSLGASATSPRMPLVWCSARELAGEVRQRVGLDAPIAGDTARAGELLPGATPAALWVEPIEDTWQAALAALAPGLAPGARLAIVASRPLARLLPERRTWDFRALGCQPRGLARLLRALRRAGLTAGARYGFHTAWAASLNLLGLALERGGYPDLGDQLYSAARLRYYSGGRWAALSTVALLTARKPTEGD